MKQVMHRIFDHKRSYAKLPLFERMRDGALEPLERIAFYPCMAHFILSFGDLNRFILRYEEPADPYQHMVNVHTSEDDHHWPWYLEDLVKLGFDRVVKSSELMRFLWGEETRQSRLLMYGLTTLIRGASARERLVIIEAIEETGNVLFSSMLPAAEELEQRLGAQLRYCGHFHFDLESGHTVGADHKALVAIDLDPEARERALALVESVFALFEAWSHELLRYALLHPACQSTAGQKKAERDAPPSSRLPVVM
jgi:hypothetical protein